MPSVQKPVPPPTSTTFRSGESSLAGSNASSLMSSSPVSGIDDGVIHNGKEAVEGFGFILMLNEAWTRGCGGTPCDDLQALAPAPLHRSVHTSELRCGALQRCWDSAKLCPLSDHFWIFDCNFGV
eukprot:CAMPEP_0202411784 /NCGR_PEP_ID=MMETSP1128-20130828/23007_1 /ASSEMBLY_ACC=CAM_ASM_000463 /TAXON_ID=3047 /ORGANISM="Dunaliella tertiolecta, Strain CCMP1320" /LENGTH=124 /DNA_ID=CAMNT_0049017565 /DNA_START=1082 /DNA_END=1455 /DNA_ORIENTATION=+